MGDINQIIFGKRHLPKKAKSVLEIGSRDYGNTSSFRDMFPDAKYTGVDMLKGNGVDAVINLEHGIGELKKEAFDLAICCSVMEHVQKPWIFAANVTKLVKRGGTLYISVPWVWRFHAYPNDYFRYSPAALESLFPDFAWDEPWLSTTKPDEIIPFIRGADNRLHHMEGDRKYLPYMNVNMVGVRK